VKGLLAVCGPDRSGNPFCGIGMFESRLQCAAKRLERIAGIVRPNLSESGSAYGGYVFRMSGYSGF